MPRTISVLPREVNNWKLTIHTVTSVSIQGAGDTSLTIYECKGNDWTQMIYTVTSMSLLAISVSPREENDWKLMLYTATSASSVYAGYIYKPYHIFVYQ